MTASKEDYERRERLRFVWLLMGFMNIYGRTPEEIAEIRRERDRIAEEIAELDRRIGPR